MVIEQTPPVRYRLETVTSVPWGRIVSFKKRFQSAYYRPAQDEAVIASAAVILARGVSAGRNVTLIVDVLAGNERDARTAAADWTVFNSRHDRGLTQEFSDALEWSVQVA